MIMIILMMMIIIIIAITIMMIKIILIIAVVIIINSPFQRGSFSTGSTTENLPWTESSKMFSSNSVAVDVNHLIYLIQFIYCEDFSHQEHSNNR